ncbi:MAG: DUF881 domain-containing protein [Thermaerobacter sp.]|nr:DUF881 domain-containing protein [Thermaerobacter sp.]
MLDRRHSQRYLAVLALIAFVLGFLVTQQIRVVAYLQNSANLREGQALSYLVTRALNGNLALKSEVTSLEARVLAAPAAPSLTALRTQLAQASQTAGFTAVAGSGVEVFIQDAVTPAYPGEPPQFQLVHDQYVLHIVGLLTGAGARAVAVNGQRYVATTAIFCAGPTIRVNGVPYGSPYVIRAVGPVAAMLSALQHDVDVAGWSQLVSIRYQAAPHLQIPPYALPVTMSLAKPAKIRQ